VRFAPVISDSIGNMSSLLGIFPDYSATIVQNIPRAE
jgi:hypothetical protein